MGIDPDLLARHAHGNQNNISARRVDVVDHIVRTRDIIIPIPRSRDLQAGNIHAEALCGCPRGAGFSPDKKYRKSPFRSLPKQARREIRTVEVFGNLLALHPRRQLNPDTIRQNQIRSRHRRRIRCIRSTHIGAMRIQEKGTATSRRQQSADNPISGCVDNRLAEHAAGWKAMRTGLA